MQWPFHKVVHLSTPLINPPLIAHCVLDCNVTIRTAPLFLFAVWGEIQHFSDLKVISLTILNKLEWGGGHLLWLAVYSSIHAPIHPSIHPAQLDGIQFFLSWKSPALGHRKKLLLLLLLYMRKKADGYINDVFFPSFSYWRWTWELYTDKIITIL